MGRLNREQLAMRKRIDGLIFSLFKEAGTWEDDQYRAFHSAYWQFANEEDGDDDFAEWAENSLGGQITLVFRELRLMSIEDKKRIHKAVSK
jgi:hypothetical protein